MNNKSTFFRFLLIFLVVLKLVSTPLSARDKLTDAKKFAMEYFNSKALKSSSSHLFKTLNESEISTRYVSSPGVTSPLYIFEKEGYGYTIITEATSGFHVVGYSGESSFLADSLPPALEQLLKLYEQNELMITGGDTGKITPVDPLLDAAGISLNQYNHANAGNCPTGCVATAMSQIMLYHKYPKQGKGSHCYTHPVYGQLCADFAKTAYNYNNPSADDLELLSFQMGVAMDMNYCGDRYGSVPSSSRYLQTLKDYFGYHLIIGAKSTEYVISEIGKKRPVYCELAGKPGHSVVLDGYDENGFMHVNFGWGGNYNGYFLMNSDSFIDVGYYFGSNLFNPVFASPTVYRTEPSDSLALLALNKSLNGATGWDLTRPVSEWKGVLVINKRAVELDLNTFTFSSVGTIPAEIGNLTALKKLSIQGVLAGTLPSSISKLVNLEYLLINKGAESGTLKGTLPADIGNLKKLKYLSLIRILEGALPASFGELTELTHLFVQVGNLTGSLPTGICNFKNLVELSMFDNKLTGTIPVDIGNLKNLTNLNLSKNQMSGSIPASIGNLTELKFFSVANNQLSDTIPDAFQQWIKIETAGFSNNQFTGPVPVSLLNITAKLNLDLSHNQLNSVSDEISNSGNIEVLNLSHNRLSTLPISLNNLNSLKNFDASDNLISELPEKFGCFRNLTGINLSNNQLSLVPEELCYQPSLNTLALSNNKISRLPYSISSLSPKMKWLSFDGNEIGGRIPLSLLRSSFETLLLHNNRFRFEDIPDTTGLLYAVGNQKVVSLSKSNYPVSLGDTILIDVRKIAPLSHPGNKYYWCRYPQYKTGWDVYAAPNFEKEGAVFTLVIDSVNISHKYYCKVHNPTSPEYTSKEWGITDKCLNYLDTDTISFHIATEKEILESTYPENYVIASRELPSGEVDDETVILFTNQKVRGTLLWQVSADKKTWYDIKQGMTNATLKANIQSIGDKEVVLKPVNTAWYRTMVLEQGCDAVFGDTIKVNAPGTILYDQPVNASKNPVNIELKELGISIPQGFHEKEFRLTVMKLFKAPVATMPVGATVGTVYDIKVSFGNEFEMPLLIKLKQLPVELLADSVLPTIRPAWFDDKNRKWIPFEIGGINLKDSAIYLQTYHLTKISWYDMTYGPGYTHYLQGKRVKAIYSNNEDYMVHFSTYWGLNKPHAGHTNDDIDQGGHPIMVQDIVNYGDSAIAHYEKLGLVVPDKIFNIYLSDYYDDAYGAVSPLGQFFGYMTINPKNVTSRPDIRITIVHELMHYLQDEYMITSFNNSFWMEANAPLASRLIWTPKELPLPEPEKLVTENLRTTAKNKSILDLLGNSWDSQDRTLLLEKLNDQADANLSSAFLHYMVNYRPGTKLNPVKLLREHGWTNSATNWTWRTYLDDQIKKQLNSTAGDEFDAYVNYLITGTNKNFSAKDATGNPFQYFIENANYKTNSWSESIGEALWGEDNTGTFVTQMNYDFGKDLKSSKTDNKSISIPYLAAQMVLLQNSGDYSAMMVEYKRKHTPDKDFKVLYGKFDAKTKTTVLTDISDSASYHFIVDKKSIKPAQEYKNYAFLLLVNKRCPNTISLSNKFNAYFELNVKPMLNIESLDYLMFGDEQAQKRMHLYDNGVPDFFSINGTTKYTNNVKQTYTINHYSSDKKILSDSIVKIDVKYSFSYRNAMEIIREGTSSTYTLPSKGEVALEQTILYNIIENTFTVIQTDSIILTTEAWTDPADGRQFPERKSWKNKNNYTIKFKCPSDIGMKSELNDDYFFKTHSSSETRSTVINLTHHYERTTYNSSGIPTVSSKNYVSTNYSADVIKLWGRFRADNTMEKY